MIATLILALGLVLIVEGLAYALAPLLVERVLEVLREIPLSQRRAIGLGALSIGVMLVWGVKTWAA